MMTLWLVGCAHEPSMEGAWQGYTASTPQTGTARQRGAAFAELKKNEPEVKRMNAFPNFPATEGPFFWGRGGAVQYATFDFGFNDVLLMEFDGPNHLAHSSFYHRKSGRPYASMERFWKQYRP